MERRSFSPLLFFTYEVPLLFFTYEEEEVLPLAVLYLWRGGASPPCCSSPMKSPLLFFTYEEEEVLPLAVLYLWRGGGSPPCCSLAMKRRRFSPLLFFTYEEEEVLPLAVLYLWRGGGSPPCCSWLVCRPRWRPCPRSLSRPPCPPLPRRQPRVHTSVFSRYGRALTQYLRFRNRNRIRI